MSALSVSGLHKAYGQVPVLEGLDLDVPKGALTAVLGASGSGKTTFLRIVAGFDRADRGTVRLGERLVDGARRFLPPERRGVGYVSQDGALFPHLSAWHNVAFGLARRERARVEELLRLVGLPGLGGRFPHQLSGGEQQRVSLARALAPRPELILLDEPFSSLDATLRASLRADVRAVLREAGVSAILVTHDQEEGLSLADQVAVLRGGRIVQSGSPQEIYDRPADPELARFVGSANLVEATLEGGSVRTALGRLPLSDRTPAEGRNGPAIALVRPEQIAVRPDDEGAGLRATITGRDFFGHDAVLHARPELPCGPDELVIRVTGREALLPGAKVRLSARGEVIAWARR